MYIESPFGAQKDDKKVGVERCVLSTGNSSTADRINIALISSLLGALVLNDEFGWLRHFFWRDRILFL